MGNLGGIPTILYKYRLWNDPNHRKLLTDQEIFLASPANLNDPFDASLPFRYNQEEMTSDNIFRKLIEVGKKVNPEFSVSQLHQMAYDRQKSGVFEDGSYWKEVHAESKENLHKTFGILSLTKHKDNLLMWAHYSNCHKGMCVGLDSEILYNTIRGSLAKVIYAENFPELSLFNEGTGALIKHLNTKSLHWRYEDEYRLTKGDASNRIFKLPNKVIREIILGCNMPMEEKVEIFNLVNERLPHVEVYEAQPSLESFKLNINRISAINF